MKRKAFTIAELALVVVILGIIAAVLTPAITAVRPNTKKMLFLKAYSKTEQVINEMINSDYYPNTDSAAPGFMDETEVTLVPSGKVTSGNIKFCTTFMQIIEPQAAVEYACTAGFSENPLVGEIDFSTEPGSWAYTDKDGNSTHTFNRRYLAETPNGSIWYLPITPESGTTTFDSTPGSAGIVRDIVIDVNGFDFSNDSPNCEYNAGTCPDPDQFRLNIRYDGKISVSGEKETEYLKDYRMK